MRLWTVGIFCLAAVQVLAAAAVLSTTETAADINTAAAAVNTTETAAANKTGAAAAYRVAVVNDKSAAAAVNEEQLSRLRASDMEPRNAGFTDRIKKWFRKLKNRIFGDKKNEATTPPPTDEVTQIIQLDKEDLLFIRRHPKRFYVDVSKLKFDPSKDWGFRLGKWYIIRKESPNQAEEPLKRPRCPGRRHRSTTVESIRDTDDDSTETSTSGRTTMRSMTTTPARPRETVTVPSTLTDSPQSPKYQEVTPSSRATMASTTVRDPTVNDTDTKRDQSAEVIAPS